MQKNCLAGTKNHITVLAILLPIQPGAGDILAVA